MVQVVVIYYGDVVDCEATRMAKTLEMFPPTNIVYMPCTATKPCGRPSCSLCKVRS